MILTITLNAAIDKRYVVHGAHQGEVNRVLQCEYTAGGKGVNVSRVLAIAKADVLAGGFVGGYAGSYIEDRLKEDGIASDFYHVKGESRSCINIWDEEKQEQTEYLEPGFTVTDKEVEKFKLKYLEHMKKAEIITLSGSAPKGVKNDIYTELVELAKSQGKQVILDTSGSFLEQGIKSKPTLIKPNIDEIRILTGKPCNTREELIQAAEEIHKEGIEYVVISLGGEGSIMVCNKGTFKASVPKIEVVNTVGCGDAMIAGFALGLTESLSPENMLRKASAISAAAAMNTGTGYYDKTEMQKLYEKIIIEEKE